MIAALFVDEKGIYPRLVGRQCCWTEKEDARTYHGAAPVVAHPPCQLWVNLAAMNYARAIAECPVCGNDPEYVDWCSKCVGTGRREPNRRIVLPAWYPGGDDGGCFAAALAAVRKYGGVLEHPAGSHAWDEDQFDLVFPLSDWRPGWHAIGLIGAPEHWVCEIWQSAYGHAARKRTWLLYCGVRPPFELNWAREPGTAQIGWLDRNKPTLGKRAASATPPAFAAELIRLAEWSRGAP